MTMSNYTDFKEAVTFLEGLSNMRSGMLDKNSKTSPSLYLKRTQALLDETGVDLKKIKFIHIAGTSGKGSVSNLVYLQLLKNMKDTGLFTSPFVTSTIEKIAANGKYIDPKTFVVLTKKLEKAIDKVYNEYPYGCPSYFECITLLALMYFIDQGCEYAVIETGLGGRYDSTNILQHPLVTAITNINLDHTEILGDTLEKIAFEKAGIIKKKSTFFTTESRPTLLEMFRNICKKKGASFHQVSIKNKTAEERNTALAQAILSSLGIVSKTLTNIEEIKLPARFETISKAPQIIVDGAHNPAKMQSTAENWKSTKVIGKRILIIGMASNKDMEETLKHIAPNADIIFVTRFLSSFRKAMEPSDIKRTIKRYSHKKIIVMLDPISAFAEAVKIASKKDAILVTGSFYLAGDIRSLYYPESYILKKRKSK